MDLVSIGAGLGVGIAIGYIIAKSLAGSSAAPAATEDTSQLAQWWDIRQTLTGTQLQILEYMEEKKAVSITRLQEKFSFIPDRELYYRLEQIVLMSFLIRERKDGEVVYVLNPEYSATVEDDKTVMLGSD